MSDYRIFIVPYDFSAHARAALYAAADLARRLDADLHLIHVIQPPSYAYGVPQAGAAPVVNVDMKAVLEAARNSLNAAVAEVKDVPGRVETHVIEGYGIADTILECAEKFGADLIVMGTHGRTGLAHVFLGSVAERTLRRAPCPVLTVQSPEEGDDS